MGRKSSRWTNLPPGMRARERGQKVHYYLDTGGKPRKEIPLGSDYVLAVQKWSELSAAKKPKDAQRTFLDIVPVYRAKALPLKAARTRTDNEKELEWLLKFFGDPPAPLDEIEPLHIRQYMEWRLEEARKLAENENKERAGKGLAPLTIPPNIGHVRANREKALFSHMWNFARKEGITKQPNPCAGISKFKETGRDTVIGDALMNRIMKHAATPLQFAIRLAKLTGQRPADVLRMSENHIADGILHVQQGKTAAKLRIEIIGELATLLTEIKAYKALVQSATHHLLVNESGQSLTKNMLRDRFDDARELAQIPKADFQFRDLRATAATSLDDSSGIKDAQALLGHTTEAMTARYIRHKVGKKVKPVA
ncbi:tyrosine-type recombinase/integrase [Comamonas odontotermitis]|uniref:tyrosine-type recombinase/integrase n=1 Tax=Comamonas odontotermitis TaxID=379895 RepID=UPI001CC7B3EE|nr:tyrosine-type recombinase/integrase [Comamonas odontotermitis]UBB15486.1 tyrosine-type recombinase/integrase [Comamonas odontotermitis]